VEQFEAWLADHGLIIVEQHAIGSGDMLRFRLRLLDGAEFDVAFSAEALVMRSHEAIAQVDAVLREHSGRRKANGG
jgi:hypothetical protein